MRVSCPSCSTAYQVPDRVLGSGARTLRCARCGAEWSISGPEAEPAPGEAISGEATPGEATVEPKLSLPARPEPRQDVTMMEPVAAAGLPHASPLVAVAEHPPGLDRLLAEPRRSPRGWRAEEAPPAEARSTASAAAWLGWAGTIILLVLLVWCGYAFRAEVMHVWPASERLYALLGMVTASAPVPR